MANSTTLYTAQDGRTQVDVTLNKTLALSDCGVVQNVIADGLTITLPATSAGACFTIRNGGAPVNGAPVGTGANKSVGLTIAPNSIDKIQGLQFTAADNKSANNALLTAKVGDQIQLVGDGVDGWLVQGARGTWSRQT